MRTPLCETCKLPHPPIVECSDAREKRMREFLQTVGRVDKCPNVGASVFWLNDILGHAHMLGVDCDCHVPPPMGELLRKFAQRLTKCQACRAEIYLVRHLNGKVAPYTPAGLIHFVDCPKAEQFRRKGNNT